MAFILIGNKKVRLPKGETDVEGFAKIVDSFYKMLTTTNQINGKKLTPEEIADLKFPPSLKTALIEKGIKFWSKVTIYQRDELASKKDVKELKKTVEELLESFSYTKETVDQLRMDFDFAREGNPFNVNVWLKPSDLGAILKISTSTITKYRNEGHFKKSSIKEVFRGKRTDFYYHRINALKDVSKIKPIQIASKKIINSYSWKNPLIAGLILTTLF